MTLPQQTELHRERNLYRGTFVAMANPCEVLCETRNAALAAAVLECAAREAQRIERKFSRYRTDSVVHAINSSHGATLTLDNETAQLIDYGAELWRLTQGAFDITSGILRHAWRFDSPAQHPTKEQIEALMQQVGWQRVVWRKPHLTLPDGMEIDFGGIGKEYAVDRAVTLVEKLTKIPVLINFGGDLRTAGEPPASGAWNVGIESIEAQGKASNVIQLASGALATSGDTRRFIEIDGRRYGHILDARTGWPAAQTPRSVTVAAPICSQAGTFATLAMLEGENAEVFLIAEKLRFWCLR